MGRNSDSSQTDCEDKQRISVALAALLAKQVDRIQGFLASGDAILIAEAVSWSQIVLGIELQRDRLYFVIANRVKQLDWCGSQTSAQLLDLFATADISHLSDIELLQWCLELCKAATDTQI